MKNPADNKDLRPTQYGFRINYKLKERLAELPKDIYDGIYNELTGDKYGISRMRWNTIIKDEVTKIFDYEIKVFCKYIGCNIFELTNPDVELLPIALAHKAKQKNETIEKKYGLSQ